MPGLFKEFDKDHRNYFIKATTTFEIVVTHTCTDRGRRPTWFYPESRPPRRPANHRSPWSAEIQPMRLKVFLMGYKYVYLQHILCKKQCFNKYEVALQS